MRASVIVAAGTLLGVAGVMGACSEISGVGRFHVDRPGEVVCDDGADDEGDALVDCRDPECGGFICADAAPAGWVGPVVVRVVAGAEVACPNGLAPTALLGEGPDLAHAGCSTCVCGELPKVTCETPSLRCGADCASTQPVFSGTGCTAQAVSGSCRAVAGVLDATCSAFGAEPVLPAFAASFGLCAGGGGGCDAGVCVEQPSSSSKVCVHADGDVECPTQRYTERHVVYDVGTTDDGRDCSPSACACDVVDPPTCSGATFNVFVGSCIGAPDAVVTGTCAGPFTGDHVAATLAMPSGGTCAVAGVTNPVPVGQLTLPAPQTLCCID